MRGKGAVGVALCAALVTLVRPSLAVLGYIVIIVALEEFPGGIAEQAVERSLRTPFYSVSVGIPGLYVTGCSVGP